MQPYYFRAGAGNHLQGGQQIRLVGLDFEGQVQLFFAILQIARAAVDQAQVLMNIPEPLAAAADLKGFLRA